MNCAPIKFFIFLFLMVPTIFVKAQTVIIYRGGTVTSPTYSSLKAAVAAAMDNDSLVLSADTFRERNVIIDKSLSIKGTATALVKTIIDPGTANDSSIILFINTNFPVVTHSLILRDIDLTNGFAHNGFDSGGGAIFAGQGTRLTIDGTSDIFNNSAADSSGVFEGSINGGAIYSEGEVILRGDTKVFSNRAVNGAGVFAKSLFLEDNVRISNNVASQSGGGIYVSSFGQLSDAASIDSNAAFNGGGAFIRDALFNVTKQAMFRANKAEIAGGGIYLTNTYFSMRDSAVITENSTDSNFAAAIYSTGNNDLTISGGQIIKNYSTNISAIGTGMALYNNEAPGASSIIRINNSRIFNPRYDNSRQNEFYNAQAVSAFISDSTWWGESDTTGLMYNAPTATVALRSWIVCEWTMNGGLPIGSAASFPIEAQFKLYTGAPIPSGMFSMLQGYFSSDSGIFTPPIAMINAANIVASVYNVPSTTGGVFLNAVVDADSFKQSVYVIGLGIAPSKNVVNGIKVFPNPATNYLTVHSTLPDTQASKLTITDMLGKTVCSQDLNFKQQEITVPIHLLAGVYMVSVLQNQQQVYQQKIVIQ